MNRKLLHGKRIAVLTETEFISEEMDYYRHIFTFLGADLHFLTYLWGADERTLVADIDNANNLVTSMRVMNVNECVTQYLPSDFDIIIQAANYTSVRLREPPPMGSLGSVAGMADAPAVRFFAEAMEDRQIIKAAMCHGLWIITPRPDLLKGRKVICHPVILADVVNAGAVFVPDESHVVVDDDLVTARSAADLAAYVEAIVRIATTKPGRRPSNTIERIVQNTAERIVQGVSHRFGSLAGDGRDRSAVARAACEIANGTLNVEREVNRLIGVCLGERSIPTAPVLVVASKFGTWASELTLVVGTLCHAGYQIKIATEDGSPPHLLGPSLDPTFKDKAWGCPVVSEAEHALALKFLDPSSQERSLLRPKQILNLGSLAKPPQVGEYLADRTVLAKYKHDLEHTIQLAENHCGLILCGGSGAISGLVGDRGLQNLILAFHDLEKPIMGQCNGGLAMAQTIEPSTGRSILWGRTVTTHSWLDEYQSGWGWTQPFEKDTNSFWKGKCFDLQAYQDTEKWVTPGTRGNPIIDSEQLFRAAAGDGGVFYSPPGSPYSVAIDGHLITCRTTPDGYPGVLAFIAIAEGRLRGRLFISADTGR